MGTWRMRAWALFVGRWEARLGGRVGEMYSVWVRRECVVWCGVRCEAGVCRALGACGLMDVWVLGAMYIAARDGAGRLID